MELMKELMSFPLPELNISLKIDFKVSKRWGEEENQEDIVPGLEDDIVDELLEEGMAS